ncbi:MAG: sorbosone dehydrogenase family protein [Akkermansiaceae bacterium]
MKKTLICTLLGLTIHASAWTDHFDFEKIPNPEGVDPQIGAMDTMKDGRIAVAFHRGELMFYDPAKKTWAMFASGLQEPLGMLVEEDGSILVMQRAELTRIRDVDGDGRADEFMTVFDDFGMTGNYHEFSYGPAKDKDGNLYIVLGVASNGAPMAEEIRGEFSEIGKIGREEMTSRKTWRQNKGKAGRMYSRAPYRGWVLKISPDGSKSEPFASGFRSPNGIGFDAAGRLLITDNQGDWRPTSPLYDVKKGGFYGHPASLVWKEGWGGKDPLDIDPKELDKMQDPPVGFFAQGELANSPTEPVVVPEGALPSALVGQTLIGEMNQPTLVRVLDDEVDGTYQTALVAMFDKSPLGKGNNRMTFGEDGSIYVGKTHLSWAGEEGITRIKWNGKPFPALESVKAQPNGFALKFSEKIDPKSLSSIKVESNTYHYHKKYGSPKVDVQEMPVKSAELVGEGDAVALEIGSLKEGYLHAIDLSGVRTANGKPLLGDKAWYQVIKAPK